MARLVPERHWNFNQACTEGRVRNAGRDREKNREHGIRDRERNEERRTGDTEGNEECERRGTERGKESE